MDDELNNSVSLSPSPYLKSRLRISLSLSLRVIVEAHDHHWRFKDTNVRLYELYHTRVFDWIM